MAEPRQMNRGWPEACLQGSTEPWGLTSGSHGVTSGNTVILEVLR